MRIFKSLAWLTLASTVLGGPLSDSHAAKREPSVASATATSDAVVKSAGTIFNKEPVPPMADLSGTTLDKDISKGYWLVEFFSPYCGHCKRMAPTWQTLYEFYYTSHPVQGSEETEGEGLNSFTRYYDFHFAKVDCVAFGTACSEHKVMAFPTVMLFKDGELVDSKVGEQSMSEFSTWIESTLETIRPGSRVKGGPELPKAGDTQAPDFVEAPKKSAKPRVKPNPSGKSVALTAETFETNVTNSLEPWFIKFYAPWCHHCQALAPNWATMARDMENSLNIGEVNCDVEKRLCKEQRVRGYPTLLFYRGSEKVEYQGLRGVGDLISYARSAVDIGSGVSDVDLQAFEELENDHEVIFVYFYDHATVSEDFEALDRLTLSLINHAKLVKTNDPKMAERFKISTWPRLMVSRDGKPEYYPHIAPKDMRDHRQILEWMRTVWQPIVPELTATNAKEIMDGHYVVLGILSRSRSDEFVIAKREIKNAALEWIDKETHARQLERQELRDAKQLRIEEAEDRDDERALSAAKRIRIDVEALGRPKVRFAWVDGVFWERWIRTTYGIDVSEGERVIINDENNKRYWDTTITGNPIVPSRTSILETLPKVLASPSKLTSKSTVSTLGRIWHNSRQAWSNHPALLSIATVLFVAVSIFVFRRYRRMLPNGMGYISLGDEKGAFGGLHGNGNAGGKND